MNTTDKMHALKNNAPAGVYDTAIKFTIRRRDMQQLIDGLAMIINTPHRIAPCYGARRHSITIYTRGDRLASFDFIKKLCNDFSIKSMT